MKNENKNSIFLEKNSAQENRYAIPYHWNWEEDSAEGRSYWCYLRRIKTLLLETVILAENISHIDLGCGDGRGTAYLGEGNTLRLTGADYSEKALSMASAIVDSARGIRWLRWDLNVEFSEREKYDSASLIEVVEHFPLNNLPEVFAHIHMVLKPKGVLLLCTPSVLDVNVPKKHYQHFEESTLVDLLVNAGFRIDHIEGQDKKNFWFQIIYRFIDNRYWTIKPLKTWMNMVVYRKFLNQAPLNKAKRFILRATKN